jgi:hypothetical protein
MSRDLLNAKVPGTKIIQLKGTMHFTTSKQQLEYQKYLLL